MPSSTLATARRPALKSDATAVIPGKPSSSFAITALGSTCSMPTSSSGFSSGCITRASSKAPASGWPMSGASFNATGAAPGPKERWMSAQLFASHSLLARRRAMMTELKRILLAEDNPKDVELTLTALEEHNLANEVVVVSDGAEALDYLYGRGKFKIRTGNHPAVILLDLKMPKVDGMEVLRTIKKDDNFKTIPVVILTSSREEKDVVESYKLGVNAYVVKPVDFQQFVDAVKELGAFWAIINESPPGSVRIAKK